MDLVDTLAIWCPALCIMGPTDTVDIDTAHYFHIYQWDMLCSLIGIADRSVHNNSLFYKADTQCPR